jgi:hypothetical protein
MSNPSSPSSNAVVPMGLAHGLQNGSMHEEYTVVQPLYQTPVLTEFDMGIDDNNKVLICMAPACRKGVDPRYIESHLQKYHATLKNKTTLVKEVEKLHKEMDLRLKEDIPQETVRALPFIPISFHGLRCPECGAVFNKRETWGRHHKATHDPVIAAEEARVQEVFDKRWWAVTDGNMDGTHTLDINRYLISAISDNSAHLREMRANQLPDERNLRLWVKQLGWEEEFTQDGLSLYSMASKYDPEFDPPWLSSVDASVTDYFTGIFSDMANPNDLLLKWINTEDHLSALFLYSSGLC